ncbi:E3 ubiquitin-protein ligase XIAP-like [Diabrotica virgifera virgifera]|uniref:Uncharacterized protein n=1 Tax=Diabrotica virgifera virgifera TaxID=50390 RepID=A0ABM5L215_DIAVI|nr:E3 ubiquitin-protein ligase XIAP-like [Diabrotica virgifera virgifera]
MCLEDTSLNNFYERLYTFKNWPGLVPASDLAVYGFYYLQTEDIVRCFHCGVEIYKWLTSDNVYEEHIKFSPNCSFARITHSKFPTYQNNHRSALDMKTENMSHSKFPAYNKDIKSEINQQNGNLYLNLFFSMLHFIFLLLSIYVSKKECK